MREHPHHFSPVIAGQGEIVHTFRQLIGHVGGGFEVRRLRQFPQQRRRGPVDNLGRGTGSADDETAGGKFPVGTERQKRRRRRQRVINAAPDSEFPVSGTIGAVLFRDNDPREQLIVFYG